jgi:hypothetical protein
MTRQQIATRENGAAPALAQGHSPAVLAEYKADALRRLCPNATDAELWLFGKVCLSQNLNPYVGDAWMIKPEGTDKRTGKPYPAYIVIHFRKRIEPGTKHPTFRRYEYGLILLVDGKLERRVGEFHLAGKEKIVGAWTHIWRKDQQEPFIHEIAFEPWARTFGDGGSLMGMWKTNPAHMICKTAVTQGFSFVFPGLNLTNLPEDGEITKVMASDAGVQSEAPLLASQDTELAPALAAGGQVDDAEDAEIIDAVDEHDDPEEVEKEDLPTPEQAREAALVKRQRNFHLFMREKGYKTEGEVKKRLSEVLGDPVTSLKAFIADDDKFLKWAEKEKYHFEDPQGDLYGG